MTDCLVDKYKNLKEINYNNIEYDNYIMKIDNGKIKK